MARDTLVEVVENCAKEFGFAANQYVAISHRDTGHQHLHIVANRIGLDGRTVSDSNSYRKMASFCRRIELKYSLKPVLSPKPFLPREQRQLPRLDQRKERLREHITGCLSTARSFDKFERLMKAKAYQVLTSRGIAFLDTKGVKVKGSEVGFSLSRIHQLLAQNQERQQLVHPVQRSAPRSQGNTDNRLEKSTDQSLQKAYERQKPASENPVSALVHLLLKHEKETPAITPDWLKKKQKRQNHRPHL